MHSAEHPTNKISPNHYEYVVSQPTRFVDPIGLKWTIVADTKSPRATAMPQQGDTVLDLATLIHLDPNEWTKWLRGVGDSHWPQSVSEKLPGCGKYTIPNTVVHFLGESSMSDIWVSGRLLLNMRQERANLERANLHVVTVELSTSEQMITRLRMDPDLYGFGYWGHGAGFGLLAPSGGKKGKAANENVRLVGPDDLKLNHKLGRITLFACYSAEPLGQQRTWTSLVAPGGYFSGFEGKVKCISFLDTDPDDPILITLPDALGE